VASAGGPAITLTPTGGYTGSVNLSASATDVNGNAVSLPVNFSANPVTIEGANSLTSVATIDASGLSDGYYAITITGNDGSGTTQSTTVDVFVQASFGMYATPEQVTVPVGGAAQTSTITLTPTGSFTISADPDWLDVQAGDETGDISTVSLSGIGTFAGNATVTVTSITDASGNDVISSIGIDCWFTSSGDTTSNALSSGGEDTRLAVYKNNIGLIRYLIGRGASPVL